MPDQRIITYIQQGLQKGFSLQQIQQNLLRNGYSQQQILEACNAMQQAQQAQQKQSQPIQPQKTAKETKESIEQLAAFITAQLKQGYALQQVQQYLLQQGYSQQQITQATNSVYNVQQQKQQTKLPTIKFNAKLLVSALFILMIIAAIAAAVWYFLPTAKEIPLKVNIILDQKNVQPGQTLYFSTKITGLSEKRKENVVIKFTVIDETTKQNIDQWEEQYKPTDIIKTNMKYTVPAKTKPGNYKLSLQTTYDKKTAEASASLNIILQTTETTCFDGKKNQNEDDTDCGGICKPCTVVQAAEEVEDYTFVETPSITAAQPTDTEKELFNKATNALSADEGVDLCKQIATMYNQYQCVHDLAQKFDQARICEEITQQDEAATSTRDRCYYNFVVTKNDFTLCDKFTNPYIIQTCYNLKKIDEISKTSSEDINTLGAIVGFKIEDAEVLP